MAVHICTYLTADLIHPLKRRPMSYVGFAVCPPNMKFYVICLWLISLHIVCAGWVNLSHQAYHQQEHHIHLPLCACQCVLRIASHDSHANLDSALFRCQTRKSLSDVRSGIDTCKYLRNYNMQGNISFISTCYHLYDVRHAN
jgi:hypothetical protein